ncbi:hypothetical protein [Streptomyces sp. 769]|uniref:hypothetical protein n=1 Tax=Streptomyces sp. 769 TaxID=1262452 RepID=UPI0005822034|nr:hypothetical protein [Streptomyces sp. 769]AJC59435.1 hypothetical protein GZL_06872 [Streptomyces sp. 769]
MVENYRTQVLVIVTSTCDDEGNKEVKSLSLGVVMTEHQEAAGQLREAERVEATARKGAGWYTRYLITLAVGQLVLVPVALLWHGPTSVFTSANSALVMGLSAYLARQRAIPRGFTATHLVLILSWAVLFALSLVLGFTLFQGSVPFAAMAAVGCALPLLVGAWREARRRA